MKDLGLTYAEAAHAMQTAVKYEIDMVPTNADSTGLDSSASNRKHLRVGVNSAMVNDLAVASLLIAKGVFTKEKYAEAVRIAMNNEVALFEERHPGLTFR
jgi:hypothetical protein